MTRVAATFVSWQYEWVAAELSTLNKERLVMFTDSDSIFQKGPKAITESFTGSLAHRGWWSARNVSHVRLASYAGTHRD